MGYRRLPLPDGFVEYIVDGPDDARDLLIFHAGTPTAAVRWAGLVEAAARAGMAVAGYSRGGYGGSPRREGRTVADEAAITGALADRLGFERFFVIGMSGGGPPALAAAALLGSRVRACGVVAGIAPRVEAGAAWEFFYSEEERTEWSALATGDIEPQLDDYQAGADEMRHMTVRRLLARGAASDPRAVALDLPHAFAPALVRAMRRSVSRGYLGFLDDNIAQARDWGFRVADIRVPVVVRHGALDRLVNIEQGRWLAATIPGARATFIDDAGHGSIALPWSEVVAELLEAAR